VSNPRTFFISVSLCLSTLVKTLKQNKNGIERRNGKKLPRHNVTKREREREITEETER
jgi:hypothetical protein